MGQSNSNLQKLCCNNNLCNFDSNVENITEINKRGAVGIGQQQMNEEFLIRQGMAPTRPKGQKEFFEDADKRMQVKNAFR